MRATSTHTLAGAPSSGVPPLPTPRRSGRVHLLLALLALLAVAWITAPQAASAQESEAPAATGLLRVTSPQPGATVYIDNEQAGEAPVVRYLPAGNHTVRVAVDNFEPFVQRVEVVAGATLEVTAQLIPGTGTVEFLVTPVGARLILNGKDASATPVRMRDLKEGDYAYRLEAPGREPATGKFSFRKGQNLFIVRRLPSTEGLVEVKSRPEGARVWLDGEDVGVTPLALEGIEKGQHTVRLEAPDYAVAFRAIDTSDGSKGVVDVRMPSEGTSLNINTGNPQGAVYLEGHKLGTGSMVRIKAIERGHYKLRVTAPDRQPAELDLEVPPKGRINLSAKLQPLDAHASSRVTRTVPVVGRWTFWAAAGVGAGAVAGTTYALTRTPPVEPDPPSDTVVELP